MLQDIGPISLVYVNAKMTSHYFIGLFKIETADSAQPRTCSNSPEPYFPHQGRIWAQN